MHPLLARFGSNNPNDPLKLKGKKVRSLLASTLIIGAMSFNLYEVSKQSIPGQQSFASTVVVGNAKGYLSKEVIPLATVVFLTSGTSYARPADWNDASNSIEAIGGGGGGGGGTSDPCLGFTSGNGGGAGAYAKVSNQTLAASTAYAIGAGGTGTTGASIGVPNGNPGGNTTWASTIVVAKAGVNTVGGTTAASTGTVKFAGGNAGSGAAAATSGAGGGAGGPNAAGNNASGTTGGRGDGTFGGLGGTLNNNGAAGAEYTATAGGTAGSGGGGGSSSSGAVGGRAGGLYGAGGSGSGGGSTAGNGAQGIIIVTYTPIGGNVYGFNLAMLGI